MKRSIPFCVLLLAGCGSPAVVQTWLAARPSPIEVNGLKVEARLRPPVSKGAKVHLVDIVATAPSRWDGVFELHIYNPSDRQGTGGGVLMTGKNQVRANGMIDLNAAKGDPGIYGRATRFETADEEITLSGAVAFAYSPHIFHIKLDKPVTVTTPSGFTVTFPKQNMGVYGAPPYTSKHETLRVKCRMSKRGRVAAFGTRVPSDLDPWKVSVTPLHKRSYIPPSEDPTKEVEVELAFDHAGGKAGPIGPISFKIRHRADIEVIPFAVIAVF